MDNNRTVHFPSIDTPFLVQPSPLVHEKHQDCLQHRFWFVASASALRPTVYSYPSVNRISPSYQLFDIPSPKTHPRYKCSNRFVVSRFLLNQWRIANTARWPCVREFIYRIAAQGCLCQTAGRTVEAGRRPNAHRPDALTAFIYWIAIQICCGLQV